jgi:hypothetical protein
MKSQTMKQIIIVLTLLIGLPLVQAQERLSNEQALRLAKLVGADTNQLRGTPISTSVDLDKPVALRDGEFGGLLLPEAKLTAEVLAKTGEQIVAIGQLWLRGLTPVRNGEAVSEASLRIATVKTKDGEEVKAPQCALGVRRAAGGELELLVYGKDKEPLLKVALTKIDAKQESPLDMDAERGDEAAQVRLKILGKYEAKFKVTQLEL